MESRMTAAEKDLLVALVIKNRDILENKRTDAVTLSDKTRCWRNIEAEFNGNSQVVKRNWKQLRKAWDNVKTKRRKAQAQETQRRLATGGGPFVPPVCDPNPELEIAIPSLSHCEQNVGDMDDDLLDSPPIPNASSGHTELEYPTIVEAPPSDVPCATTVMGGPIRTPSSSGGMTRGAAVERELQDRLEGLKTYNAHRDKIQALRQETAQVELATAKLVHDFQLRKMKRDEETQVLQLEVLRLQRMQQEQALAQQKRMDDIQIKIKEQELRQMMVCFTIFCFVL
ncbi:uncharacterized protein LOC124165538 isoform X1 [Ischnura elegans]|uniref:uncharacterized protein LOC124165538 isoform X1 n=1 Tax=Ischnura elegans TaxID=197161 RepID=UPI001ED86C7A|nr:uncharacterized protein LOC124165538 isoform X1 [Ischnura elegans]